MIATIQPQIIECDDDIDTECDNQGGEDADLLSLAEVKAFDHIQWTKPANYFTHAS